MPILVAGRRSTKGARWPAALIVAAAALMAIRALYSSDRPRAVVAVQQPQPEAHTAAPIDTAAATPVDAAAAAAGLARAATVLGSRSTRWAPLVLSSCLPGMPPYYAPCMVGSPKNPGLVYGEELIYPEFSIPEPIFTSEDQAKLWRTLAAAVAPERYQLRNGRGVYKGIRGQNLVFRNVTFRNSPPNNDGWTGCHGWEGVTHRGLVPLPPGRAPQWPGRAVLANSAHSNLWPHFIDRVTKTMVQSEPWRREGTRIVSGQEPISQHIVDIWDALLSQGGQQERHHMVQEFSAGELLFPCRTPLIHPYHHERLRELLRVPEALPLEERKTVLYFSRNQDGGGGNSNSRKVLNEAEVLAGIQAVLQERGRGEELLLYDQARFPHMANLIAFLQANVSAIVGPHGGAMANVPFAAPDTLLLEFMPEERFWVMYWEEGSLMGQRYAVIILKTQGGANNMIVDPAAVQQILRQNLGVRREGPAEPQHFSEYLLTELV